MTRLRTKTLGALLISASLLAGGVLLTSCGQTEAEKKPESQAPQEAVNQQQENQGQDEDDDDDKQKNQAQDDDDDKNKSPDKDDKD